MTADGLRKSGTRWLKFNAVGGIGIAVQLAALKEGLHLDYLLATALAVQAAVVHNFLWHARFTWVDRSTENGLVRFLEFNLTTGAFSIAGNLLIMRSFDHESPGKHGSELPGGKCNFDCGLLAGEFRGQRSFCFPGWAVRSNCAMRLGQMCRPLKGPRSVLALYPALKRWATR